MILFPPRFGDEQATVYPDGIVQRETLREVSKMEKHVPGCFAKGLASVGFLFVSLLPWQASVAEGIKEAPLRGTYFWAGKTLVDPPPEERRDSHLYLELTGGAARDLYARLKAQPMEDPCGEAGETLKTQGAIQCSRDARGREYRCWMGIELAGQRIVSGGAC